MTAGAGTGAFIDDEGNLHVGPRVVPPPAWVSDEARRFLALPRGGGGSVPRPIPVDDLDGWHRFVREADAACEPMVSRMLAAAGDRSVVETTRLGGVTVHVATPTDVRPGRHTWARITVHGGAFVLLGGRYAAAEAALAAAETGCVTFGVDYRRPPEDPYPASVDDVVSVYGEVLERYAPAGVAVSGASAGGNIAAAAVLKARDSGLPLPACLLLMSPACDLTFSGDSFATNRDVDVVQPFRPGDCDAVYAGGADVRDPYVSPIFGDFTRGFPPTYIATGTRDIYLSNSAVLHRRLRRAGVEAELHVWEAGPHGNFPDGPEREDVTREEQHFLAAHLPG